MLVADAAGPLTGVVAKAGATGAAAEIRIAAKKNASKRD
jgi:hypothetical protein